jgi:hypothetical protein
MYIRHYNTYMANRVFLNDNRIIEIVVDGDQTRESVQKMGDEAFALSRQHRAQGKKTLLLDNLLLMGSVPPDARKLVVELIKSHEYDKLAMVGSGGILKLGANLMLQATGKGAKVKYFDHYETAVSWLLT